MGRYVIERFATAVVTIIGVVTIVFFLVRLLPGDPAKIMLGVNATPEQVARLHHALGLDLPVPAQYLRYVGRVAHADLGLSVSTGDRVEAAIMQRLPYTLQLTGCAMAFAAIVGVRAGVVAAVKRGGPVDLVVSGMSVFGMSMPTYWLGILLIIVFAIDLHWLPAAGADDPRGLVLPAFTLGAASIGLVTRMTRSAVLEVLSQDYVRTATAKGVPWRKVLARHALRNALLPIITAIALQVGALLAGAVLVEATFSWPGLGTLLVDAIFSRDYPVVQGIILFFTVSVIAVNFWVDLLYRAVDPRIRFA